MKKILMTSMVAASMMFVGCGSSSSSTPKEEAPLPVVNNDINKTEDNTTVVEEPKIPVIAGTTVIGAVRFMNMDNSSVRESYDHAKQYCETSTLDNGGWSLPKKDELLLIMGGDNNDTINTAIVPLFTPDEDQPEQTSHTSALWGGETAINTDNGLLDTDFVYILSFTDPDKITTQSITDTVNPGDYYTVCVKDVNTTN